VTQAYNLSQLANKVNTSGQVDVATGITGTVPISNGGTGTTSTTYCNLASNVTGTLPVARGGTGATTLTANNVLLGNGTSAVQVVAPGTNGNVLTSNGTTWTSAANTLTSTAVGNAYAGLSAGSVGSLAFAKIVSGGTYSYDATIAGSNLRTSNADGSTGGSALSGTWRSLGWAQDDGKHAGRATTLWLRIS